MEIDQEEGIPGVGRERPAKVWSREKAPSNVKASSPEDSLLNELDNMKIPTTFSQLTSISPAYTKQVIARLQEQLSQKSTATYIAPVWYS